MLITPKHVHFVHLWCNHIVACQANGVSNNTRLPSVQTAQSNPLACQVDYV